MAYDPCDPCPITGGCLSVLRERVCDLPASAVECGFCEGEGCDWCWHLRASGAKEQVV